MVESGFAAKRVGSDGEEVSETLTLSEVLELGIRLQRRKEYQAAEEIYRALLQQVPDEPTATQYLAILYHQTRRFDASRELFTRALEIDPRNAGCWSNYGNVMVEQGDAAEALRAYRKAIALAPGFAQAHANLGVVHRAQGDLDQAEAAYRRALSLDGDEIGSWYNLSNVLLATGRAREAIDALSEIMTRRPETTTSYRQLALAFERLGQHEDALATYREWQEKSPEDPQPAYHIEAMLRSDTLERAPERYVEHLFDDFANSFDVKLERLDYRAPVLVEAALSEVRSPDGTLAILDAGCGTGWCGPLLRPYARRLDGVDLSAGMLEKAAERGVYDGLQKGELVEFIASRPGNWDAIVVCDTLCYFGRLDEVAEAIAQALTPSGLVIATCEVSEGAGDYEVFLHGRFAHRRDYFERSFADVGMTALDIARAPLRVELQEPVEGWVGTFQKR